LAVSIFANQNCAIGKNAHPFPDFLPALANSRDAITRPPGGPRRTGVTLFEMIGGVLGSSSHQDHYTAIPSDQAGIAIR
jgi:hypothetical protein